MHFLKMYLSKKIKGIKKLPAVIILSSLRQTCTRIWHPITTNLFFKKMLFSFLTTCSYFPYM